MNNHYRGTSRLGRMNVDARFVGWLSIEQEQRIQAESAAIVARSLAEWQKPAGLPMDAVLDALNELANMTAEEEALLNQIILDEEAGL
jgi:hypothetical protein